MAKNSGLIGVGFAEHCRLAGEILEADHAANFERRQNMAAAAEAKAYAGSHAYRVKVVPVHGGYQASTLEHPPFVGALQAVGRSPEVALTELRFVYALQLRAVGLISDFDDCRRHAAKAQWVRELDLHGAV